MLEIAFLFLSVGHVHLLWLWKVGPEKKGRIYVRVQIPGGQRPAVTDGGRDGERERLLRQRKSCCWHSEMNSMSWLKLDVMLAFFFKRERERAGGQVPVYMQTFEPPSTLSLYPLHFCSNWKPHLVKRQKLKETIWFGHRQNILLVVCVWWSAALASLILLDDIYWLWCTGTMRDPESNALIGCS